MKKIMCFALATGMLVSCLGAAACGDKSNSENSLGDIEGKTLIKVASYNGGLGLDWLREAAGRFSAKYEGKSFEAGKMGVIVFFCIVQQQPGTFEIEFGGDGGGVVKFAHFLLLDLFLFKNCFYCCIFRRASSLPASSTFF